MMQSSAQSLPPSSPPPIALSPEPFPNRSNSHSPELPQSQAGPSTPRRPPRAPRYTGLTLPSGDHRHQVHDGYSSDTSLYPTSPIRGSRAEQAQIRQRKGLRLRAKTIAASRQEQTAGQADLVIDEPHSSPLLTASIPDEDPAAVFQEVLQRLNTAQLTWGDFLEWASDYSSSCSFEDRYRGFFRNESQVTRVLDHWISWQNCPTGRRVLKAWTLGYICRQVQKEGDEITRSHVLQSSSKSVDESFVLKFDLLGLYKQLAATCPISISILHAVSTTPKQESAMNNKTQKRKQQVRY